MKNYLFQKISPLFNYCILIWTIIGLGVVFRLVQYLSNRSLWLDEPMLALNIIDKSFVELLRPLDYNQVAPIGFLIVEKFFVTILNNSEYSLRLFPFIAGVASLFLFYKVANYFIKSTAIPIALGLLAISGPLIYYSSEIKQYSSDLFIGLLLFYYAASIVDSKQFNPSMAIFYGVLGATAIWFSHPAVFILAGTGISLAFTPLIKKEWKKITWLSIAYFLCTLSFITVYFLFLRNLTNKDYLVNFWSNAFMPFPPSSISDIKWLISSFFEVFKNPVGTYLVGIGALTFLIGSISIFSEKREVFFVLMLPLFLVLLASGFRLYPFNGRCLIFIAPVFLLFMGEGAEYIREKTKNNSAIVGIAIICLLFLHPATAAVTHLIKPVHHEEIKPVINYVLKREKSGDKLYLYYASIPAYRYYMKIFNVNMAYIEGKKGRENWQIYLDDLDKLRGNNRVWIIFSHVWTREGVDEEKFFLNYLNSVGTKLDEFKSTGASVYLYGLDK